VANRVRAGRRPPDAEASTAAEQLRKRCSPSWARLIAKVYRVDRLLCARCGQRMSIVAFLTDAFAIRKIRDPLGLSTPDR
jgi:hypothetical protein